MSKTVDHRGRPYEICTPEDLPQQATEDLKHALRKAGMTPRRVAPGLFGGLAGYFAVALLFGRDLQLLLVSSAIGAGLVIGVVGLWWYVSGGRTREAAVAKCLMWGICPACGYPLSGSSAQGDGCRVCAECGAAWRAGANGA